VLADAAMTASLVRLNSALSAASSTSAKASTTAVLKKSILPSICSIAICV
jgi:hypothetical protein